MATSDPLRLLSDAKIPPLPALPVRGSIWQQCHRSRRWALRSLLAGPLMNGSFLPLPSLVAGLPVPGVRRDSWHQAVSCRRPAVMSSHWLALTASAAKIGKKAGLSGRVRQACSVARPSLPSASSLVGNGGGAFGGLGMCFREGLRSQQGSFRARFLSVHGCVYMCVYTCVYICCAIPACGRELRRQLQPSSLRLCSCFC